MRVLIVDDHEGIRRGIHALLSSRADWEVCAHAVDGLDAIEKAKQLRPDVVLMDISMPSMDGIEATRLIRQERPESQVIIVSQNDPAIVSAEAKEVGAAAFVGKANLARELISTIDKVVNGKAEQKPQPFPVTENPALSWINGGGEMAALMRSTDWSKTPLGEAKSWSPTLRTMVSVLLASRFPQLLWWGPEFCCLYNDAYIPVLATKHPCAIGRPVAQVWHEIWDVLKPLIETPFRGGPATWAEDIELVINRRGYEEETHFTVAYSPVPDDAVASGIGGVLATVHEITEKVIGERRIAALRELAVESAEPGSAEEACVNAATILAEHKKDVPFVMLYLMDTTKGDRALLAGSSGVDQIDPSCPNIFEDVRSHSSSWPVSVTIETEKIHFVENIAERFTTLPASVWDEPVTSAAIVPIRSNVAHQLAGFMIVGLSPRSPFDESYRNFLELMSTQIATTIANARAYEEERKRAEALAEIDRAKTTFFSNVSHEFRTPLTLMLGPVQDLLSRSQTHLTPTATEQLEIVNRNGSRLLRLVNTLLDFSRIEAGRVTAVYQATDLAAFTSDLAGMFRSATERAGLQLEVDCPPMNGVAYVDRDMWEKIVLNLISNAFKFTFEGKISVDAKQVGQSAELRISDTGVGIPPEELPKLFDRFHRVPNARSRTHEGSGIGLSLVNELVKLHGGSIRVESTVDRGTTFIVTMPLGQDHLLSGQIGGERSLSSTATGASPFVEEALRWLPDIDRSNIEEFPLESELLPQSAGTAASKNRVLIADDNADMRQYLVRLLSGRYEVTAVADGQSALESIRKRLPDLVLSDVMMPNLDGFGLLQALRSDSATNTVPVILLSARAGEDSRVEGLKAGADDYLVKPFSARELLARVQSHLDLARVRKDADKRIRENEERLRAFVTASSDVVYRMSADWAHMYYLQGKDFIDDTNDPSSGWLDKYIHPEDQAQVLSVIHEAIRNKATFELEHRILRTDGNLGWAFSRAIPVLDEQNEIIEWFGTATDVTARRIMEEELRQSRSNLELRVKQRTEELERAQSDLRDLSAKLLQLQDEERRRIASELHDSAGQTLTVLSLNLAELESVAGATDSQFAEKMAQVHELVQRVTQEIRTTSYLLHPPLLDENGITAALAWYVEGLSKRTSLQIDLSISQQFGRLPKEMELAIFRIVQECLTNILRHSGSEKAKITLERDECMVFVSVQDFGKGIPDEIMAALNDVGAGVGVRGMKQRVRHLNGQIGIASGKSGTTISVTMPLTAGFTAADRDRLESLASATSEGLSQLN